MEDTHNFSREPQRQKNHQLRLERTEAVQQIKYIFKICIIN